MRRVAVLTALFVLTAVGAEAAKKWFHCYGPDECEITQENRIHPVFSSGNARASKKASERIASVCIAAGFSHYKVVEETAREGKYNSLLQPSRGASKTIRAKFFHEEVEDGYLCSFAAKEEYIARARKIAKKNGYPWPVKPPESPAASR